MQDSKEETAESMGNFSSTTRNYIAFKEARSKARKIRRKSQRETWIGYVSSITSDTSSKKLWQKVKSIMSIHTDYSISFMKENGQTITSTKNIANTIGRTLPNISSSDSYPEPFLST